jgi:hypothetical protein
VVALHKAENDKGMVGRGVDSDFRVLAPIGRADIGVVGIVNSWEERVEGNTGFRRCFGRD